MFKLKQKIIKHSILSGKKHLSENLLQINFKQYNKKNKKKAKKLIQLAISYSSFVFKHSKIKNINPYFHVPESRILFAVKQSLKYKFLNKVTEYKIKSQIIIEKKKQLELVLNKKILYFYRWNIKK